MLFAERLIGVQHRHALGVVIGCHLREQKGRSDSVLIPDIVAEHVAIALLVRKDHFPFAAALQGVFLLGDKLEAREGVVAGRCVAFGHRSGHFRGDDGFQSDRVGGQLAGALHGVQHVIKQHHTGLVAGHDLVLAVLVSDHDAHPVAVRVGAQDKVHIIGPGQLHGQIETLRILRVRRLDGGKISVDDHLPGLTEEMLHPGPGQGLGNQLVAAAVEGGVNQLEAVRHGRNGLRIDGHGHNLFQEGFIGFLSHDSDHAGLDGLVVGHDLHAGEDIDLLQLPGDGVGVLRRQLGPILPVDLIAVVLLWIVAGGDVDARLTAVVAYGEAQLRSGAQRLEDAHLDSRGGADLSGGPGKLHTVEAAVHADGHALLPGFLSLCADDVGKALGGVAHHVEVHMVQPHGHGAAKAGGAELQRAIEPALNLLGIVLDGFQLGVLFGGQHITAQPFLIFLQIVHENHSSFSFMRG